MGFIADLSSIDDKVVGFACQGGPSRGWCGHEQRHRVLLTLVTRQADAACLDLIRIGTDIDALANLPSPDIHCRLWDGERGQRGGSRCCQTIDQSFQKHSGRSWRGLGLRVHG